MKQAMPQQPRTNRCTVEEYFRLAEASPTKLEYKAGELIDMAGTSISHIDIASNLIRRLGNRLDGGPCRAMGSDLRVRTAADRYCYPDLSVICGEVELASNDPAQMTITNPSVLFEILSPSTESTDRGEKFFRYIRIPSLKEYFLVAQDKPRIESFVRQADGSWQVGAVVEGMDAVVRFESLKVEIPLGEIYDNVQFEEQPPQATLGQ